MMAYLSLTGPGVVRGPHEHAEQTDCFCFLGPSAFRICLWDTRPFSPTQGNCQSDLVEPDVPLRLIVPPGVVHAYQNVGTTPGLVFNAPNRLYRGPGKTGLVDEIRHEERPESPFRLDNFPE